MADTETCHRHKRHYFVQFYNLLELSSSILLITTLPLRYTNTRVHWYMFAVGYFLWALRIFKYSCIFSSLQLYSEIIRRVIVQDFVQFSILFLVLNTIFAGTFLLVLKGDEGLDIHSETSSFQGIMGVGLRILIEAASIVDYTGPNGYRTAGTIGMLLFMFLTIVVLLNILIAQISETYTRVHDDSLKTVRAYRAYIVARSERNQWHLCRKPSKVKYYTDIIKNVDKKALENKDASEIENLLTNIAAIKKKQIKDGLEIQTLKTRQWRFNTILKQALTTHHSTAQHLVDDVNKMYERLEEIKKLLKPSGAQKC